MTVDQRHSLAKPAHVTSVELTLVLDAAQNRLQLILHQLHAEDADGAQGRVETLCRRSTNEANVLTTQPLTCTCAAVPLTVGGAAARRNPPVLHPARLRVRVRRAQHHPAQVLHTFLSSPPAASSLRLIRNKSSLSLRSSLEALAQG